MKPLTSVIIDHYDSMRRSMTHERRTESRVPSLSKPVFRHRHLFLPAQRPRQVIHEFSRLDKTCSQVYR